MKIRALLSITLIAMMLTLVAACGDSGKSLDMEGLGLGKELSGMMGEATKLLGGITDLDSAKAAMSDLTKMDTSLAGIVSKVTKLSPESKASFSGLAKKAMPALESAIAKVVAIPGVGETLKPTTDSIVSKIKGMF